MTADITEVRVTFGNGIKREEFGPTKKAEVTITAAVDKGQDGRATLDEISELALRKTAELLGAPRPAEQPLPPTSSASQASPAEAEPQRRTRRTKEQIAADNAAAEAAKQAATNPTGNTPPADEWAGVAAGTDAPAASEQQAADTTQPSGDDTTQKTTAATDDWTASETATITDADLNQHCSTHAARVKDPLKVRGVIAKFNPGTDAFNPDKGGKKFGVSDIPQEQRPSFVKALEDLTA